MVLRKNYHFFILYALVICLMGRWTEFYRAFLYLNLLAVCVFLYQHRRFNDKAVKWVLAVPVGFMLLHWLAVGGVELVKDIRHLWLAAFVALGVYCLAYQPLNWPQKYKTWLAIVLVTIFCLAQIIGFSYYGSPYGIMTNPHYLGFYSAVGLFIGISQLPGCRGLQRYLLLGAQGLLAFFVLYSSSRPTWIALILSCLLWLLCMLERKWVIYFLLLITVLFVADIGDFSSRLIELAKNITADERVVIWNDAVRMLQDGSLWSWLVGHGAMSFERDFAIAGTVYNYFNSPHNSILEVIYLSGLAGLLIFLGLYLFLFYRLYRLSQRGEGLILLLMAALLFHFLMVFSTVPLFSSYNLYPQAFISGMVLYLTEKNKQSKSSAECTS